MRADGVALLFRGCTSAIVLPSGGRGLGAGPQPAAEQDEQSGRPASRPARMCHHRASSPATDPRRGIRRRRGCCQGGVSEPWRHTAVRRDQGTAILKRSLGRGYECILSVRPPPKLHNTAPLPRFPTHARHRLRPDQARQVRLRHLVPAEPRPGSVRRPDPPRTLGHRLHHRPGQARLLRLRVPRQRHHPVRRQRRAARPDPQGREEGHRRHRHQADDGDDQPLLSTRSSRTAPSPAPTRRSACSPRRR